MNLDLFKNLEKNVKNEEVREFIKELSSYLDNFKRKSNSQLVNQNKKEYNFINIDEIEKKYHLNMQSALNLREERDKILQEYVKSSSNIDELYYVTYKNNNKDIYAVAKYNKEGEYSSFNISGEELPSNIEEDLVMKKDNNEFVIDEETTKVIMDKIIDSAEKIFYEQNDKLNNLREEDCLYRVVDIGLNGIHLQNTKNNIIFEEVNIPQEVKDVIGNDYILRYKDGTYVIEEELTDNFFENLLDSNDDKKKT